MKADDPPDMWSGRGVNETQDDHNGGDYKTTNHYYSYYHIKDIEIYFKKKQELYLKILKNKLIKFEIFELKSIKMNQF